MARLSVRVTQFHRDNHYIPRSYLRCFASPDERIFTYRTLVPHKDVPFWKRSSIGGVGYLSHLYTRIAAGSETDEIETWLDREFETPAAEPLRKATSGARLSSEDYRCLVRFLAAQIVRTPAYFVQNLPRWKTRVPEVWDETIQGAAQELAAARRAGKALIMPDASNSGYFPLRVTTEVVPRLDTGQIKGTVVVGRGLWQFHMRSLLTNSAPLKALQEHKWSILSPHDGLAWFTSDDPVIRLNYYKDGRYDFKGGLGKPGTEILLPLSPYHLFYTRVGHRPPPRGTVLPRTQTQTIRRFIAEHAFRMIIAASPQGDVAELRPRTVSGETFQCEREAWLAWHAEQTAAERSLHA